MDIGGSQMLTLSLGLMWAKMVSIPIFTIHHQILISVTLKRQERMRLKMSSAEVVCCKWSPNITEELSIEENRVDPEQTAPMGAVWSGSTLFAIEAS